MIRRRVATGLCLGICHLALGACQSISTASERTSVDVVIHSGQVFDGTGAPGRSVDIAIDGDTIAYIGPDARSRFEAGTVVDASGLVVSPGFIDPHTHAGSDLAAKDPIRRANLPFAFQGVTTVVVGNDGRGAPNIAASAASAIDQGIGTNVAYLVGLSPVREAVLDKEDRAPDPGELERMKLAVHTAMCEGAWGLSTGLYYVPQNYAQTDEVIALAKVAGGLGGYYDTHMRDESTYNITVTGALAETLKIGRKAGLPVHIAHIKALGPAVWGHSEKMIAMVDEARASGQKVSADQYPWSASGTRISSALVPRWAMEGGLSQLRERLSDNAARARIRGEMIEAIERRGGAEKLLVTGQLSGSDVPVGKTLAEIAADQSIEPVDAAMMVLVTGDARLASFNMSEEDIAAFAAQDWVVTGSDGSTGHPRKYASFPKAYRDFVVGAKAMDLARFIHRSSGQTAAIIGLKRRGRLKVGYFADLVLFDPDTFAPRADYQNPRELSAGVVHLFVNGEQLIADGQRIEILPGRPLLKPASPQCAARQSD